MLPMTRTYGLLGLMYASYNHSTSQTNMLLIFLIYAVKGPCHCLCGLFLLFANFAILSVFIFAHHPSLVGLPAFLYASLHAS
jgi:hypothetical protein